MNFIYTVNPNSKNPIMLVNKSIGEDGIMGCQFQEEIFTLVGMGAEDITVYVNSVGGSVIEGMSIYNSIIECKVPVTTINVGVAASIASVIFLAGTKRIMYDYSVLMVHNPFNSDGSEDKSLDIIRKSIITMIAEKCNLTEEKIGNMMDDTTWITSDSALKSGLCDEIKKSGKSIDDKQVMVDLQAKWETSNLILNKLLTGDEPSLTTKNNNKKMTELIEILNEAGVEINATADEKEVYNVIKALLAKRNEDSEMAEDDCNSEAEDKYNELKKAYDALVNELMDIKQEAEDKKAKEMEDKISNLINSALKNGKIKNTQVEMCRAMAKVDYATFENFINELPTNKKAVKIETADNKVIDERLVGYKPDPAAEIMNKVSNKLK